MALIVLAAIVSANSLKRNQKVTYNASMDVDLLFKALADPTRRALVEELATRDGQTLFELYTRMIMRRNSTMTRQGFSKHLALLERAGLLRIEWGGREKRHFLDRTPLEQLQRSWLPAVLVTGNPAT